VSAYGQTLQLDQETYQDQVGIEIEASDGVLVVYQTYDYEKTCWLITKEKSYTLSPTDGYSTTVHVHDDGTLTYYRSWREYETTFNQETFAPLYCCTSRDHVLYQLGSGDIKDGKLNLKLEKNVTLSDEYDVDELFAQAKADEYAGEYFSSFETVDEALAANANRE
jgi:maltodextrin utilization protein YvdJ